MRTLYLFRHGVTEANERRLYCGWTDLPLSYAGRKQAQALRGRGFLPDCAVCVTSGLARTDETLALMTGRKPDIVLESLREMNFGAFEMRGYEELMRDADYRRWIEDLMGPGVLPCPGGESQSAFRDRVFQGGEALLRLDWDTAIAVLHGGVIATLMPGWFPGEVRGFYQWQPGPCDGWRVHFDGATPVDFEPMQEAT